jgi:hypothetical protein
MQAYRQNTRQLATLQTEVLEWQTHGYEWSIINYGPGNLWFSYTPGVDAAPGALDSTELRPGFSFTDSAAAPRYLELSLAADAPLTYCLNTNQRMARQQDAKTELFREFQQTGVCPICGRS